MTTANSANRTLVLGDKPENHYMGGHLRYYRDSYTFTAAAGATAHTIYFAPLPAGRIIVIPHLSKLIADDADATADLHMGYDSYVRYDTVTVAADDNFWLDNVDIGAGAVNAVLTAVTGVTAAGALPAEFNTLKGLTPTLMVDTADQNIGDVYTLELYYIAGM